MNKENLEEKSKDTKKIKTSKLDFEEVLENQLNAAMQDYQEVLNIVEQYQRDKRKYNIFYYIQNGAFIYERFRKRKIGFNRK